MVHPYCIVKRKQGLQLQTPLLFNRRGLSTFAKREIPSTSSDGICQRQAEKRGRWNFGMNPKRTISPIRLKRKQFIEIKFQGIELLLVLWLAL